MLSDCRCWQMIADNANSYDCNDLKYHSTTGAFSPQAFFEYLAAAFDTLYAEGLAGTPKMMTVGLHCRITGKPARAIVSLYQVCVISGVLTTAGTEAFRRVHRFETGGRRMGDHAKGHCSTLAREGESITYILVSCALIHPSSIPTRKATSEAPNQSEGLSREAPL